MWDFFSSVGRIKETFAIGIDQFICMKCQKLALINGSQDFKKMTMHGVCDR